MANFPTARRFIQGLSSLRSFIGARANRDNCLLSYCQCLAAVSIDHCHCPPSSSPFMHCPDNDETAAIAETLDYPVVHYGKCEPSQLGGLKDRLAERRIYK